MNMPIMDPEQYLIADEDCVLDVSKGKRQLGWVPQYRDEDMLIAAYTRIPRQGRPAWRSRRLTCRPNRRSRMNIMTRRREVPCARHLSFRRHASARCDEAGR